MDNDTTESYIVVNKQSDRSTVCVEIMNVIIKYLYITYWNG